MRDIFGQGSSHTRLADGTDVESWQPFVLDPISTRDVEALTTLLASGRVTAVHDRIDDQLAELAGCADPTLCRAPADRTAAASEILAGQDPWEYGNWVWYPWSGRLVHVLPREEFRRVRTDRNRDKVTRAEQARLLDRCVAVIGLSVGGSAALTCALEGVGGAFRLADHDQLGLSDLNRLRAGIPDLGLEKTVLCARQMYEIDPYLDIEIHRGGVTEQTIADFFDDSRGRVDLLIEECDTPWVKLAAREHARQQGIPVLMDTNDRGLLDVERFDIDPNRPLLHGRLGTTRSADVTRLNRAESVELLLRMVDEGRLSPAMADAIPRIGRTLNGWPRLASGVMLGAALVTDTARRILLGHEVPSGRFYVDLDTHAVAGDLVAAKHGR